MKTKNIFKALALAMLMPAMLLTTACSSEDDVVNNTANTENTINKGYALPVTVNVTREGDAATRATYTDNSDGTGSLGFRAGDKLFVNGSDKSANGAGQFAGELTWQSGGTFSGTIYTKNPYSGTADELFSAATPIYATLLPYGYESTGFLYVLDNNTTEIIYDDVPTVHETYAFVASETAKATGVEQLSWERADAYNSGFALTPLCAVLNFTISGLAAGTQNVTLRMNKDKDYLVTGSVTPNASGVATFAVGVKGGSTIRNTENNLTVGSSNFNLPSSTTFAAGKIYNITRNVALTNVTASDIGKLIGADGSIYSTQAEATAASTTAVAMIAYVGEETYDDNYKKGLAITLADESSTMNWSTAKTTCEGKTAVTGAKWCLPSEYQWYQMLGANGGEQGKWSGLNTTITSAGGTGLQSGQGYWTSSEANSGTAYYLYIMGDGNSTATIMNATEDNNKRVRACLVF